MVHFDIHDGRVGNDRRGARNRHNIVIKWCREGGVREILEPALGRGVLQSRIAGANDVGRPPVTTHELVSQHGQITGAHRRAGIVVLIGSSGVWIIDGNQLSGRVYPVTKIALSLLQGGNAQDRT